MHYKTFVTQEEISPTKAFILWTGKSLTRLTLKRNLAKAITQTRGFAEIDADLLNKFGSIKNKCLLINITGSKHKGTELLTIISDDLYIG